MSTDLAPIIDAETVARVILDGDLSKLTASQKTSYYRAVCESVGLNPLTQPFAYIPLNGGLKLYALKGATDQLRQVHKIAIVIAAREVIEDTYVVTARASMPDGRTDESIGAVPIANLKGESRANAMMKAETKAKRRVTLSICGLGMLDESEVESIPMGALAPAPVLPEKHENPAAATGETRGTLRERAEALAARYAAADAKRVDPPSRALGTFTKAEAIGAAIKQELIDQGRYTEPVTDQVTLDPGQQDDLPTGYVRIERIDEAPTKNKSVTKYTITLSTGEILGTINTFIASLAKNYLEQRTPVRIKTRHTKYGVDLIELKTANEWEPPEPPPTPGEIPL